MDKCISLQLYIQFNPNSTYWRPMDKGDVFSIKNVAKSKVAYFFLKKQIFTCESYSNFKL